MKKLLIVFIIVLASCTATHQSIQDLTQEGIKDTEISKDAVRNLLQTWPYRSGIIHAFFRADAEKYSVQLKNVIVDLDTIADLEDPTERQLGEAAGLFLRLAITGPQAMLDRYEIDLLKIAGIAGISF